MEKDKLFAFTGNYLALRRIYFGWRGLIVSKKIDAGSVSEIDRKFFLDNITHNAEWTDKQAFYVWNYMLRYKAVLKEAGVDMDKFTFNNLISGTVEPPKQHDIIGFTGGLFTIKFNKVEPEKIKAVKDMPGRIWNPEEKMWTVPLEAAEMVREFAEHYKFLIGDIAKKYLYELSENLKSSYSAERIELNLTFNGERRLYDYQTVGVDWVYRINGTLLADAMGLGKTPQAIASAVLIDKWPVLVTAPKNLIFNWQNEVHNWTNKKAVVLNPDKPKECAKILSRLKSMVENNLCHFLIVNFDGCKNYLADIKKIQVGRKKETIVELNPTVSRFQSIIIDEAHELKNPKTDRSKVILKMTQAVERRLVLTGTPIVNKIDDMATMLDYCGHLADFGGYEAFVTKYGEINKEEFESGRKVSTNKNKLKPELLELNNKLRSICMIRREKYQVLTELPDKMRKLHEVEITNRKEYNQAMTDIEKWMEEKGKTEKEIAKSMTAEFMVKIGVLKRLSGMGKVESIVELANSLFLQGEKLVVFGWYKDSLLAIKEHFPDMNIVDGDVNALAAQGYIKQFQTDPNCRIIGGSFKSMGVGHTLTAASHWACVEHPWHDAILSQAEDRCHRIGQKNTVFCHHFMGKNTIDKFIYDIILKKRALSKVSTGGTEEISEEKIALDMFSMFKKMSA